MGSCLGYMAVRMPDRGLVFERVTLERVALIVRKELPNQSKLSVCLSDILFLSFCFW